MYREVEQKDINLYVLKSFIFFIFANRSNVFSVIFCFSVDKTLFNRTKNVDNIKNYRKHILLHDIKCIKRLHHQENYQDENERIQYINEIYGNPEED